jgi:hypothetical protein
MVYDDFDEVVMFSCPTTRRQEQEAWVSEVSDGREKR